MNSISFMPREDKNLERDDRQPHGGDVVLAQPNMGRASGRLDIRRPMDLETIG